MIQPFAILQLMYIGGILGGVSTHTLLHLLLCGADVGMRLLMQRKRDF